MRVIVLGPTAQTVSTGACTTTISAIVVRAETSRDLIHVGVAHGRGFTDGTGAFLSCFTSPANATLEHVAAITAMTNPDFPM